MLVHPVRNNSETRVISSWVNHVRFRISNGVQVLWQGRLSNISDGLPSGINSILPNLIKNNIKKYILEDFYEKH